MTELWYGTSGPAESTIFHEVSSMRVLVCGGRKFDDIALLDRTLSDIHGITDIIHGGATGADTGAHFWAGYNGVDRHVFLAKWQEHGRAAGPIRNQRMLDEGKPDLVVAFPGGKGTADMVRRAKRAGIPVREVLP